MGTLIVNQYFNPLLLDNHAGTVAAYSLRKLKTGVDYVAKIRRSSDNTEMDFAANEITDGTLISWVGAGNDGFVSVFYDQSGNFDLTQAALTKQPQIVANGALRTINGKPALYNINNTVYLENASLNFSQPNTALFVAHNPIPIDSGQTAESIFNGSVSRNNFVWQTNQLTIGFFAEGTNRATSIANASSPLLINALFSGDNSLLRINAQDIIAANPGTARLEHLILFAAANPTATSFNSLNVFLSEAIIFNSDVTSDRARLEQNINSYYNLY